MFVGCWVAGLMKITTRLVLRALSSFGLKSFVPHPTHLSGGYIDHVYVYSPLDSQIEINIEVKQQGVYFPNQP